MGQGVASQLAPGAVNQLVPEVVCQLDQKAVSQLDLEEGNQLARVEDKLLTATRQKGSTQIPCVLTTIIEIDKTAMVFPTMKRLFTRKQNDHDFSKDLGEMPKTKKQRLLEHCQKNDVSIYIDNPSEQSYGIYAELRGTASEAELERRLNAKKVVGQSNRANIIAALALLVSVVALVNSFQ